MSAENLTELKAQLAMRAEDRRIAIKHREEAAAVKWSPESAEAYERAEAWAKVCIERENEARGRVIRATLAGAA